MTYQTNTIAESNNFIVLDHYKRKWEASEHYQSEADLESELIHDLCNQGYELGSDIKSQEAMFANVRSQLQALNDVIFTENEWQRFKAEYLDNPSDTILDKTRKIHTNYIYDFTFDDGHIENIYLIDKKNLIRNKVQFIQQFEQTGTHTNRYDVTVLVNGIPLVQIELKRRGVAIREAFNQIHRYSKESFNSSNSLFKYLQIFVISNGTDTRYFANTTKRDKNSFDFTINWAKSDNTPIKDLKDFTATFFQKNTLLNILFKYSIFDTKNNLLIMRPYQIAATERILWKIKSSYQAKKHNEKESGGYIWHTTGSGKTLTSFKTARLATQLDFIDKVFFVVDRKDLDTQTMKEYQRFSPDSVNGSTNTKKLKLNLEKDDNKIIVTTIQKLNHLMKGDEILSVYQQRVVFIFDECHRSQFGEVQAKLKKKFTWFYQFGFTGTPIFDENALQGKTTSDVFGVQLHSYIMTDAIRDEKVLKFKVDYNDVRPQFKNMETETDVEKLNAAENKQALLHPKRIQEITNYILKNFRRKTHRLYSDSKGFNAMFAVNSVDAAKAYYEAFRSQQAELQSKNSSYKPLMVATIFSFLANEEQDATGDVQGESFDVSAMNSSAREFLEFAIKDYNVQFKTNFSTDGNSFENYYRDLSSRVREQEIDLLIVVGMFLTGFDAPRLNTLFVDKNLRYHRLIQAFSRTNRICDSTKTFGNIVTFRDLEQATIDAITLFGKADTTESLVLEKSYSEYMQGFTDSVTGERVRGFIEIIIELENKFYDPAKIVSEKDKKAFVKLFGEYMRTESKLQNYDEFAALQKLQDINLSDPVSVEKFKSEHYLDDDMFAELQSLNANLLSQRTIQDYLSTYNDICDWQHRQYLAKEKDSSSVNWDDVVFEVDLLKSQEINLDYILELIFKENQKYSDKRPLIDIVKQLIRTSLSHRAKESLLVDFVKCTNLNDILDKAGIIEAFYNFAQESQQREANELIAEENLNNETAKRYLMTSLKRGYASKNGTDLNETLPKMSPLNPQYTTKKQIVFEKIAAFVEKFKGIGGSI